MLQKTLGIVLRTLKYNDTSFIADLYTEVVGRASFIVRIPRSRKTTVKSILFQPLALVELEADFPPNANLYKIKEAKSFIRFLLYPTIRTSRLLLCFFRNFYIMPCVRRRRIVRCLLICSIPLSGWMSVATVMPISIWFFRCVCLVSWGYIPI